MEDKRLITEELCKLLKLTDNFEKLKNLEYSMDEFNYNETITATFENGYTKKVNVTADSGTALISDVVNGLLK